MDFGSTLNLLIKYYHPYNLRQNKPIIFFTPREFRKLNSALLPLHWAASGHHTAAHDSALGSHGLDCSQAFSRPFSIVEFSVSRLPS
jgi:hypothetical protein